jgi:branched-chain amino acid transport system permease protein
MDIFLQQVVNAIVVGTFYGLIALGYSMVYGIIRLLNFAHGDLFMLGAFAGFSVLSLFSGHAGFIGIGLALLVSVFVVGMIGLCVERVAYRPLIKKKSPRLNLLITAVGVSLAIEYSIMLSYGPSFRVYPIQLPNTGFQIGDVKITYVQLGIILLTVLIMIALQLFIHKSIYGKAMRSIAIDDVATSLMGVPVNRLISLTFFIGSGLAAVAGVMDGIYYGQINFLMGFLFGLKAFTAAVIGGIGSINGAMLGGLVLGIVETLGTVYVGGEWKDVFAFAILILFLVLKPTGLLGEAVHERV